MMFIVNSTRTRKLMNRLHTGQAISSHRPPSSIAFQTFRVMIVIHDDKNMAAHHNENNICLYMTIWLFPLYKQTTVIWNFHKMPFVCLLPNKQVQFITKMRVVPTGGEHKGGMMKDEQMTLSTRKPFISLETQNWTQRIILKHLKSEDVGMLTLSSFLNATAGGCRHIPDLLFLFVIVVLILVLIVLVVDQSALGMLTLSSFLNATAGGCR